MYVLDIQASCAADERTTLNKSNIEYVHRFNHYIASVNEQHKEATGISYSTGISIMKIHTTVQ